MLFCHLIIRDLFYLQRYCMFCQQRQQNEGLPPTSHSLYYQIEWANYQKQCLQPIQDLLSPSNNSWEESENAGWSQFWWVKTLHPKNWLSWLFASARNPPASPIDMSAGCLKCHVPRQVDAWATSGARIPIPKCKMRTVTRKDNVITP